MSAMESPRRTPLEFLPGVSRELGVDVWVKREDKTNAKTGGNKVRKLRPLLEDAAAREATHLITIGAAGSNHVLTAAVHGREAGLEVHAALVPHPDSERVRRVLAHTAALGATLLLARNEAHAGWRALARWIDLRRRGFRPYFIPPGGTNILSTRGCMSMGEELLAQVDAGEMPRMPRAIYCVLGTGGTAASLAAALSGARRAVSLIAVLVYPGPFINRQYVLWLARRAMSGQKHLLKEWRKNLRVDKKQLGRGYGYPFAPANEARDLFARDGLYLDSTYTARAGAALIAHVREARPAGPLLLWYTHPNFTFESGEESAELPSQFESILIRP